MVLPRCKYGDKCHDKSAKHIEAFSHPCPYGDKCYRKSADHKKQMTHDAPGSAGPAKPAADSRYFECTTPGHHKYWQSRIIDNKSSVRFGKIGTSGVVQVKKHPTSAAAESYIDAHIADKLKKGYVELKARPWSPPDSPSSSPGPSPKKFKKSGAAGGSDEEEEDEDDTKKVKEEKGKAASASASAPAAAASSGATTSAGSARRLEKGKEFWEGALEGTNVRVSFGKIGSAGSTGVKPHVSVEKAKAYLEKTIAEKLKDGYKEATPEVKAWKPIVSDKDDKCSPIGSKFMGKAFIPAGTKWPECGSCHAVMPLFLQLNLDELSDKPGVSRFSSKGLLQLFYCVNDCDDGFEAFSRSSCCRVVDPSVPGTFEIAAVPDDFTLGKQITGWEGPLDDNPTRDEASDLGMEVDEDYDLRTLSGEKLGGWPFWIQSVEYPDCTVCGGRMSLLFQIDSECNIPFMLGDAGIGHITQCPTHKNIVAFAWACS